MRVLLTSLWVFSGVNGTVRRDTSSTCMLKQNEVLCHGTSHKCTGDVQEKITRPEALKLTHVTLEVKVSITTCF